MISDQKMKHNFCPENAKLTTSTKPSNLSTPYLIFFPRKKSNERKNKEISFSKFSKLNSTIFDQQNYSKLIRLTELNRLLSVPDKDKKFKTLQNLTPIISQPNKKTNKLNETKFKFSNFKFSSTEINSSKIWRIVPEKNDQRGFDYLEEIKKRKEIKIKVSFFETNNTLTKNKNQLAPKLTLLETNTGNFFTKNSNQTQTNKIKINLGHFKNISFLSKIACKKAPLKICSKKSTSCEKKGPKNNVNLIFKKPNNNFIFSDRQIYRKTEKKSTDKIIKKIAQESTQKIFQFSKKNMPEISRNFKNLAWFKTTEKLVRISHKINQDTFLETLESNAIVKNLLGTSPSENWPPSVIQSFNPKMAKDYYLKDLQVALQEKQTNSFIEQIFRNHFDNSMLFFQEKLSVNSNFSWSKNSMIISRKGEMESVDQTEQINVYQNLGEKLGMFPVKNGSLNLGNLKTRDQQSQQISTNHSFKKIIERKLSGELISSEQNKQVINLSLPNLKKTIIFDLEDTLVCFFAVDSIIFDFECETKEFLHNDLKTKVAVRPHLQDLLGTLSLQFDLMVYSSCAEIKAGQIINRIDPSGYFSKRFYKKDIEISLSVDSIKDIPQKLGCEPSAFILVDDQVASFADHVANGVPVIPFLGDKTDDQLLKLKHFLMSMKDCSDFREVISRKFTWTRWIEKLNSF